MGMRTLSIAVLFLYGAVAAVPPAAAAPVRAFEREHGERWEDYLAAARKDLAALEAKLEAYEARARELAGEARRDYDAQAADLRRRKAAANGLYNDLEKSAGKARKQLKKDFDVAIRDFKAAYRDASSK